eukprot:CAMPEP_0185173572 /NCGR_PEP_ID=MMETSP1139-20130426/23698_1 /TAXON_ID=298111 /ORGANISM="Pavlova sp., Strain CCMP459" /LENGTH=39 /DNA_ID= /DNA_START= /DNA_END= /DNA_ORIENTATION=
MTYMPMTCARLHVDDESRPHQLGMLSMHPSHHSNFISTA